MSIEESSISAQAFALDHLEGQEDLPEIIDLDGAHAPRQPTNLDELRIDAAHVRNLAVKLANTTYTFTTEWAAERLHLQPQMLDEVLQALVKDTLLQVMGQVGPFSYRYMITDRGTLEAKRLMDICGYIGPAPVSLAAYSAMLDWQIAHFPKLEPQKVAASISRMVLPEDVIRLAGLSISSGRSLFLSGPAGNGKTSLGRLLHKSLEGDLWIPYCIGVDNDIIRVFDPLVHKPIDLSPEQRRAVDRRWIRIQRPLVVAGGELTIEALDLAYSPSSRFYEAPLHMKSNGGLLLLDDFGRQRVEPHELLNRWIVPLEYSIDHYTLNTGQQIKVPFRQVLVVATNLNLRDVTDPAFLRRIGYQLRLEAPSADDFREIFRRHAEDCNVPVPAGLVDHILERYRAEHRERRACHPRDLINRALDLCEFERRQPELNREFIDLAWVGYFGAV